MASEMFRVKALDFAKGAATAALAAFLFAAWPIFSGVFLTPNFDIFHAAWSVILTSAFTTGMSAAAAAFVGYIGTNFFTNSEGKLFGRVKIR